MYQPRENGPKCGMEGLDGRKDGPMVNGVSDLLRQNALKGGEAVGCEAVERARRGFI